MTIEPDTKDWTWVLQRPCPECGLDTHSFPREGVADMIRVNAAAWHSLLDGPGDHRLRPAPGKWSALEYGCHVRDVLRLYDERLSLMLTQDGPQFPNWDQDATAIADRYGEQDPVMVARDLATAAEIIAAHFDGLAPDQWPRTGIRSDGAHFTVESFARYLVHDPVHHLYDVTGTRNATWQLPTRDRWARPVRLSSRTGRHLAEPVLTDLGRNSQPARHQNVRSLGSSAGKRRPDPHGHKSFRPSFSTSSVSSPTMRAPRLTRDSLEGTPGGACWSAQKDAPASWSLFMIVLPRSDERDDHASTAQFPRTVFPSPTLDHRYATCGSCGRARPNAWLTWRNSACSCRARWTAWSRW